MMTPLEKIDQTQCFSEPAPMVAKEGVWVWSDLDMLQTRMGNALYNGEEEGRDMWLWLLRKLFVPRNISEAL